MLRHVNSELTNKYWNYSYNCIRKNYPEYLILIIDDNSEYNYVVEFQPLYKTIIINSEYKRRGEVLPYYYYLHNKLFDIAVIIHDSVFINLFIEFNVSKYKLIWEFEHDWDQLEDERGMINIFNDKELLDFYDNKNLWKGCYGGMSVITHDFLLSVNKKYDISKLLNLINSRFNRCSFERVIACLLQITAKKDILLGSIHDYCVWGIPFNDKDYYTYLPITKVWSGR